MTSVDVEVRGWEEERNFETKCDGGVKERRRRGLGGKDRGGGETPGYWLPKKELKSYNWSLFCPLRPA